MNKYITCLLCALMFTPISIAKELVLGVVPQQAANVLAKKWVPFVQELSSHSGLNIRFATAKSIPEFERKLSLGEYDIAYMNPYHYVVFSQEGLYDAIAMQDNKTIQGILVKRKDNPMTDISELSGETVAFPAPAAFAATLLPRAEMAQQDIEITPQFVRSHDSVYMSVARGIFPAGGGIKRTFNTLPDEIKAQIEVFWTTQSYTPHAFATHRNISDKDRQVIVNALVNMHATDKGKAVLSALGMYQLRSAQNSNWDDVRKLNLDSEVVVQQ